MNVSRLPRSRFALACPGLCLPSSSFLSHLPISLLPTRPPGLRPLLLIPRPWLCSNAVWAPTLPTQAQRRQVSQLLSRGEPRPPGCILGCCSRRQLLGLTSIHCVYPLPKPPLYLLCASLRPHQLFSFSALQFPFLENGTMRVSFSLEG